MTSLRHVGVVALAAAVFTAAIAAPWSASGGAFVASALLLVPALLAALVLHSLLAPIARRPPEPGPRYGALIAATFCARDLWLLATTFIFVDFVDAPRGLHSSEATGLAAVVALVIAWRVTRTRRFAGPGSGAWVLGAAALALTSAIELELIDTLTLRDQYPTTHAVALTAALLLATLGFVLLVSSGRRALAWVAVSAGLLAGGFGLSALRAGPSLYPEIMASHSAHARVIAAARRLFDQDGDGYSALFGGGDCDDHDPTVFPLSTVGYDCLGWHAPPETPASVAAAPRTPSETPTTVVLITIDAFRCGFGVADRPEFRNLCPNLTQLAAQGFARLDGHANFPFTARSITALQTGDLYSNPTRAWTDRFHLASFFAARGFATRAIVTHPYVLADPEVRASFQSIDESLIPASTQPGGATAEQVTDHAIAALRHAHGPLFLWAHYLDPHAPYVREGGDLTTGDPSSSYGAEVRRTDAAIARLAQALAARPDAARTLLFVTADHGEAFGEHGLDGHGLDLHEELLRVPMIAWTAGQNHRALGDRFLPASTTEVADYLTRLFTGDPPPPPRDIFARMPRKVDPQLAVIATSGWKLIYHHANNYVELYDLAHDPTESHDLAAAFPQTVVSLGGKLADFHRAILRHKDRSLDERNLAAALDQPLLSPLDP